MASSPSIGAKLDRKDFEFFRGKLLTCTGIVLSEQKSGFLNLRLQPRLDELGLDSLKEYRHWLEQLPPTDPEWQQFINQLTTNRTGFFREPRHFQYLLGEFLPQWEKRALPGQKLMVWSAVCSTGEEPYTLAMCLEQYFRGSDRYQVFASDIDTSALSRAANGVFPISELREIPEKYRAQSVDTGRDGLQKWFRIKRELHRKVKFFPNNLLDKALPFQIRFDVVFCRNVFIYFKAETVEEIADSLRSFIAPGGLFCIGHSETLQNVSGKWDRAAPSTFIKSSTEGSADPTQSMQRTLQPSVGKLPPVLTAKSTSPPAEPNKLSSLRAKKRVLIVDDSPTMTKLLANILKSSPDLEVVGEINKPREVEAALRTLAPDVMTLDINMPEMDGCAVLRAVMDRHPVPTVMISSVSIEESPKVLEALELGAVDYIQKPAFSDIKVASLAIIEKVKEASLAKVIKKTGAGVVRRPRQAFGARNIGGPKLIAIGSSTGGTEALRHILVDLPATFPPILIAQHIPPVFSNAFAKRLNEVCELEVREAKDGDAVRDGLVLIAPGGVHMIVRPGQSGLIVRLEDTAPVNRHKPSVDVLFDSVARHVGRHAAGVILTGMGADGARGLLKMRDTGSHTIAQDEASCVVFGMPKEAIKLGGAAQVLPLNQIAEVLISLVNQTEKKSMAVA